MRRKENGTKKEERATKTVVPHGQIPHNTQKQDDVDLLNALAKWFFAFMPAEHNYIKSKLQMKQRLRHKERQRCGKQRMHGVMKTCPSISLHNSRFTTVKNFTQQGNVSE